LQVANTDELRERLMDVMAQMRTLLARGEPRRNHDRVQRCTRCSMAHACDEMPLEGVYRWIVFAPSKMKSTRPVAARFFGAFTSGTMKIRGLACRRHDTPPFIKQAQEEMLMVLAMARNLEELNERRQEATQIYNRHRAALESGAVDPRLLIVEQVLSREIEEYAVETRASLAARELIADGVTMHPGERIGYVIADAKAKNKAERIRTSNRDGSAHYDRQEYATRLEAAAKEIGAVVQVPPSSREEDAQLVLPGLNFY
jgi:DNA polymerase elongation subunit (family B)